MSDDGVYSIHYSVLYIMQYMWPLRWHIIYTQRSLTKTHVYTFRNCCARDARARIITTLPLGTNTTLQIVMVMVFGVSTHASAQLHKLATYNIVIGIATYLYSKARIADKCGCFQNYVKAPRSHLFYLFLAIAKLSDIQLKYCLNS